MAVQTTFEPGKANLRLGRKAVLHDHRTLQVRQYLRKLPPPPEKFDGTYGVANWGMLANDRLGDCTCASLAHMDMAWSAKAKQAVTYSDEQVVDLYNRVNGGHDDGAVELIVLREMRANGLAGHKLHAFASCETKDPVLVRQCATIFDGLYIGVGLPITAQSQEVWDDTGQSTPEAEPWGWGGHAVNVVGYDPDGLTVVTWGSLKRMTWKFWNRYTDEAWAVVPEDFQSEFFDQGLLDKDLKQVSKVNP